MAAGNKHDSDALKPICRNRRAYHEYEVFETLECGLALTGTEVKSLRDGAGSLEEAYAKIQGRELWLIGSDIPEYAMGNIFNHKPKFGLLSVVVLGGAGWLVWSHSGSDSEITRENAAKVQVGMSLAEVEAVLGGPARDESTGPIDGDWKAEGRRVWRSINRDPDDVPDIREWISDAVELRVELDQELRVIDVFSLPLRREYDGVMGPILRWLGR